MRIERRAGNQAEDDAAAERQRRRTGRHFHHVAELQRRHQNRHQQDIQHSPAAGPFDQAIGEDPVMIRHDHTAAGERQQRDELAQRKNDRTKQHDQSNEQLSLGKQRDDSLQDAGFIGVAELLHLQHGQGDGDGIQDEHCQCDGGSTAVAARDDARFAKRTATAGQTARMRRE